MGWGTIPWPSKTGTGGHYARESPVSVVMGTGVGGTCYFKCPPRVLVLEPRRSSPHWNIARLYGQIVSAGRGFMYKSQHVSEMQDRIVVVMPKSAVSKAFGLLLNKFQGQ